MKKAPKIAIVTEFLTVMGGAENVVLALHEAFPKAPIYTAIYDPEKLAPTSTYVPLGYRSFRSESGRCISFSRLYKLKRSEISI
jgi:hypothetical protein